MNLVQLVTSSCAHYNEFFEFFFNLTMEYTHTRTHTYNRMNYIWCTLQINVCSDEVAKVLGIGTCTCRHFQDKYLVLEALVKVE